MSSHSDNDYEFTAVSEQSDVDEYDLIDDEPPAVEPNEEQRLVTAAGIGSAVLGCWVGGPMFAIVLGVGAKYACEQDTSSCMRDIARAVGEVALLVHTKARQLDEKHAIVEESQRAVVNFWNRVKELDERHRILERTKEYIVTGYHASVEYADRHHLVERCIQCVGSGMLWLAEKVTLLMDNSNNNSESSSHSEVPQRLLRNDDPNRTEE